MRPSSMVMLDEVGQHPRQMLAASACGPGTRGALCPRTSQPLKLRKPSTTDGGDGSERFVVTVPSSDRGRWGARGGGGSSCRGRLTAAARTAAGPILFLLAPPCPRHPPPRPSPPPPPSPPTTS